MQNSPLSTPTTNRRKPSISPVKSSSESGKGNNDSVVLMMQLVRISNDAGTLAPSIIKLPAASTTVIGRQGDVIIDSARDPGSISRKHAIIHVDPSLKTRPRLYIENLSTNGLLIDNQVLARGTTSVARVGQTITFGGNPNELHYRLLVGSFASSNSNSNSSSCASSTASTSMNSNNSNNANNNIIEENASRGSRSRSPSNISPAAAAAAASSSNGNNNNVTPPRLVSFARMNSNNNNNNNTQQQTVAAELQGNNNNNISNNNVNNNFNNNIVTAVESSSSPVLFGDVIRLHDISTQTEGNSSSTFSNSTASFNSTSFPQQQNFSRNTVSMTQISMSMLITDGLSNSAQLMNTADYVSSSSSLLFSSNNNNSNNNNNNNFVRNFDDNHSNNNHNQHDNDDAIFTSTSLEALKNNKDKENTSLDEQQFEQNGGEETNNNSVDSILPPHHEHHQQQQNQNNSSSRSSSSFISSSLSIEDAKIQIANSTISLLLSCYDKTRGVFYHTDSTRQQLKFSIAVLSQRVIELMRRGDNYPNSNNINNVMSPPRMNASSSSVNSPQRMNNNNNNSSSSSVGGGRMLNRISLPCHVFGDLHGSFADLLFIYEKIIAPLGNIKYCSSNILFLGDYVDRGAHSVEVVAFLFSLKVLAPNKITLQRGNHESPECNSDIALYGEGSFLKQCHNFVCGSEMFTTTATRNNTAASNDITHHNAISSSSSNIKQQSRTYHNTHPNSRNHHQREEENQESNNIIINTEAKLLHEVMNEAFSWLPLATIVGSVFACHAGIPHASLLSDEEFVSCLNSRNSFENNKKNNHKNNNLESSNQNSTTTTEEPRNFLQLLEEPNSRLRFLNVMPQDHVDSPSTAFCRSIAREMIWNDVSSTSSSSSHQNNSSHQNHQQNNNNNNVLPFDDLGFRTNLSRGATGDTVLEFNSSALEMFLKKYKFSVLLRAHQCKNSGLQLASTARALTIFSASNYSNRSNTAGGVLIDTDNVIRLFTWCLPPPQTHNNTIEHSSSFSPYSSNRHHHQDPNDNNNEDTEEDDEEEQKMHHNNVVNSNNNIKKTKETSNKRNRNLLLPPLAVCHNNSNSDKNKYAVDEVEVSAFSDADCSGADEEEDKKSGFYNKNTNTTTSGTSSDSFVDCATSSSCAASSSSSSDGDRKTTGEIFLNRSSCNCG